MVILINHPAPEEGIHHQEKDVTAFFKRKNIGKGTLYIAESLLCWISNAGEGFSLEYQSIYIHAISRDLTSFPHQCLYLMVDGKISLDPGLSSAFNNLLIGSEGDVAEEEVDEDSDSDEEGGPTAEMRFVPDNSNMLDVMFRALSDCQALNPDPNTSDIDDDIPAFDPPFPIYVGNVDNDDLGMLDPPFPIIVGNVENGNPHEVEDDEGTYEEEEGEAPMNEEQFEDAEQ